MLTWQKGKKCENGGLTFWGHLHRSELRIGDMPTHHIHSAGSWAAADAALTGSYCFCTLWDALGRFGTLWACQRGTFATYGAIDFATARELGGTRLFATIAEASPPVSADSSMDQRLLSTFRVTWRSVDSGVWGKA